jgi:hypothetical protein
MSLNIVDDPKGTLREKKVVTGLDPGGDPFGGKYADTRRRPRRGPFEEEW